MTAFSSGLISLLTSAQAAQGSEYIKMDPVYEIEELFELGIQVSYLLLLLRLLGTGTFFVICQVLVRRELDLSTKELKVFTIQFSPLENKECRDYHFHNPICFTVFLPENGKNVLLCYPCARHNASISAMDYFFVSPKTIYRFLSSCSKFEVESKSRGVVLEWHSNMRPQPTRFSKSPHHIKA